ncbi:MAG: hypothetical protein MI748_16315, partial [Opitutales bacterium]|nr:hypothetical protein [Opitutales bacterium]
MESESIGGHSSSEPPMLTTSAATLNDIREAGEHPEVLMEDTELHPLTGEEGTTAATVVAPPVSRSAQKCLRKEAALPRGEREARQARRAPNANNKARTLKIAMLDPTELNCLMAVVRHSDRTCDATVALNRAAAACGTTYTGKRAAHGDVFMV